MNIKLFANMHNHSTHSDGVYTPRELVEIAKKEGFGAMAVTDHDTVTGNAPLAEACAEAGLDCLFGAEFTSPSDFSKNFYHICGYSFDPTYPEMAEYLRRMSFNETNQTKKLFDRGLEIGYLHDITWQDVLDDNPGVSWICNEPVFRSLKKRGLAKDTDYPEFFAKVYGPYRATVPNVYPFLPADELIDLVRRAGGFMVLAHPHGQLCDLKKLCERGLRGVEVWHSMLTADERREALTAAGVLGLYVSGGEDHEGLCGGQYSRYGNPKESPFYFDPMTLGTTEYFFREMQSGKTVKKDDAERRGIFGELLSLDV
ncbi:MAG: PHP domain-containing protein [Clostridia bacterium]|nr:PHP domain-containing protein [Clostridia bacterium]